MRINIVTSGRFHLLDLARELAAQGHDVSFYSFVPRSRCERFGLPRSSVKATFPLLGTVEHACRKGWLPYPAVRALRAVNEWLLDNLVALRMRRCDVLIATSGVYVRTLSAARKRFDAKVLLERGCKHALTQYCILAATPGARVSPKRVLRRELKGYELADYIVIASQHVQRSFTEHGTDPHKLFVDPYGMSLSKFHPTPKPGAESWDVIMVGGWMYRKGCDLLAGACQKAGLTLLHVGSVVDCPLPEGAWFTHVDSVDESRLVEYYARAKVFALPSREDGFGMVLSQALACGLPIVCSQDTGGPDLAVFLEDKRWIRITAGTTAEDVRKCLEEAMELYRSQPEGLRNYAGKAIGQLTWEAYGRRYDAFLKSLR